MDWDQGVVEPVRAMLVRIMSFIPTLIGVIIILVVGWFIAKAIQKLITNVLRLVKLDVVAERTGIRSFLAKGDIRYTLSELVGVLVYWLTMLIVFTTAVNAMGLTVAATLLDKIVTYIPNVIASVFILVLGLFFATLMGTIVRTAASNAGISEAKTLGQIAQVILIVFSAAIALEQLNIGTRIIGFGFNIILGAIGLALALAFGLGGRETAGRIIEDIVHKFKRGMPV